MHVYVHTLVYKCEGLCVSYDTCSRLCACAFWYLCVVTSEHWHMHFCILFDASGGVNLFREPSLAAETSQEHCFPKACSVFTPMRMIIHRVF